MKNTAWLGLAAAVAFPLLSGCEETRVVQVPVSTAPPPSVAVAPAVPADLSPGAVEVVRLAEAGTGEDVILAYIQNSQAPFNLSANDLLYLKDVGVSQQVATAMLNHDNALRNQPPQYTYDQRAYPATVPPPAAPAPAEAPAPAPEQAAPPAAAPAVASPPPVYVSNPPAQVSYFYNDLSPYGTWIQLAGYGWCWQPRVVVINPAWRPYGDGGHWVWTDAGWFWQSAYSWGWAPFHYGRWYLDARCGWVWLPDTVWGPAWVTWRTTGAYWGWAPLPPHADFVVGIGYRFNGVSVGIGFDFGLHADHFTFVAANDFCERDLGHRYLAPTQVTKIYNQTTIINNYTVNNNTIINQGVAVERVAAATHTQIHKATIRDLPAGSAAAVRTQSADTSGAVVYRPQLKAPARAATMVAQKVDEQHPIVRHAPIASARGVAKSPSARAASAPAASPHQPQTGTQKPSTPARTSAERAAPYSQNPATAHASQPAPAGSPAAATARKGEEPKNASRALPGTQPAPVVSSSRTAAQPAQEVKPATRSLPGYKAEATVPQYPLGTRPPGQAYAGQKEAQSQNPHVYYPKGFHQGAEVRPLPESNPRKATPPAESEKESKKDSKKDSRKSGE